MKYGVIYSGAAQRSIKLLERKLQQRILNRAAMLAENPRPAGSIKLTGEDAYRVRVGDYRIIYSIDDGKLIVLIVSMGHRRDIYRGR